MLHDLCAVGTHEEGCLFDFVVKERIVRAYEAVTEGIKVSFGAPYCSGSASIFDVPFYRLKQRLHDFNVDVHDFSCEDVYDYATEFEDIPLSFFALVGLFSVGIFTLSGNVVVANKTMADGEMLSRIQSTYCPDLTEDDAERLIEFRDSYLAYIAGDRETAFKSDIFRDYCEQLSFVFSPRGVVLPPEYAADNLFYIMICFVDSTEDYCQRYIMYTSREVALYDTYKELLPEPLRDEAEMYLDVFRKPVSSQDTTLTYGRYGDYTVAVVTEFLPGFGISSYMDGEMEDAVLSADESTRYFNTFFEPAVKWLDRNLPLLRQKYCKKEVI